ncbi:MAG: bifunctional diaminohydroxyphosphoribosylaminopyrimidine deaminase/5-amino-6-(5-phosphoribosylamino)uracil reductase RibD [Sedimentisphaerales bacterium]|nr:bifunctional diaminohydroxyphosphoribosylaminopyrimidine deaminase/5-amino-6-(5-phosphoribosylamino)uracil reductase RibD [Sedimentisphaerales bacterium]
MRQKWMRQALRLAAKGGGFTAPNPRVGAVIVRKEKLLGKGYHKRFGGPHAEVNALADCRKKGHDPAGSTMFVTLEPCCHQGKTPPCTEAILAAGIKAVEIATLDEFKEVAGQGAKQLRQKGVKVTVGCCEQEARRLNAGFFKVQQTQRPLVILKWAQSLDGKLTWPENEESPTHRRWLTGKKAREHVHHIRSACGAVLVGIGTVLADDPMLNVRLKGKHHQPLRVILDSRLQIPPESKLVKSARKFGLLVCTDQRVLFTERSHAQALIDAGMEVMGLPAAAHGYEGLDLDTLLTNLAGRGILELLVEGGPKVHDSFLAANLADRIMAYIAPVIIGTAGKSLHAARPLENLENVSINTFADDVLVSGDINFSFRE